MAEQSRQIRWGEIDAAGELVHLQRIRAMHRHQRDDVRDAGVPVLHLPPEYNPHAWCGRRASATGAVNGWRERRNETRSAAAGSHAVMLAPVRVAASPRQGDAVDAVERQRSKELGALRAWTAFSKPELSLIKVGSLNAVPMQLIPTGRPKTLPIGTLMIG